MSLSYTQKRNLLRIGDKYRLQSNTQQEPLRVQDLYHFRGLRRKTLKTSLNPRKIKIGEDPWQRDASIRL